MSESYPDKNAEIKKYLERVHPNLIAYIKELIQYCDKNKTKNINPDELFEKLNLDISKSSFEKNISYLVELNILRKKKSPSAEYSLNKTIDDLSEIVR